MDHRFAHPNDGPGGAVSLSPLVKFDGFNPNFFRKLAKRAE